MSDVFISYAKENIESAQVLAKALERAGYSVWWDRHIPPGKTWDEVIGHALDDATCMIVLWSTTSVHSRWVREEAEKGASRNCLIPALIEKVEPPFGFGLIQAADLSKWHGDEKAPEFADLLQAVSALVKATRKTPAPVGPSDESGKHEPDRRGRALIVKSILAAVGLIVAGYFALKFFYTPEPQILSFRAIPASIERGKSTTLSWHTRNASEVKLEGVGLVEPTGKCQLSPSESQKYTLTAANKRGRTAWSSAQVTVTIPPPPLPPSPSIANWIRIEHKSILYVAKFYVRWEGQAKQWESGPRSAGYSAEIPIPPHVKIVLLNAQALVGVRWRTLFRRADAPVQRTYTVTGTPPRISVFPPLN